MSRKKAQKSEVVAIGIFQGKEAEYNKAILKTLLIEGPLTTWEIAKNICHMRNPGILPEVTQIRSQKIYSVIQRKKGRLEDLYAKEYVMCNKEGKNELKAKGLAAILVLEPDLISKMSLYYVNEDIELFKQDLDISSFSILAEDVRGLEDIMKRIYRNPRFYVFIAQQTKQMISKGINLDAIKEDDFMTLVFNSITEPMDKIMLRELFRKNPNIKKVDMGKILREVFAEFERTLMPT